MLPSPVQCTVLGFISLGCLAPQYCLAECSYVFPRTAGDPGLSQDQESNIRKGKYGPATTPPATV